MKAGTYLFLYLEKSAYWVQGRIDSHGEYFIGDTNICSCDVYFIKDISEKEDTGLPTLSDVKNILTRYSTLGDPKYSKADIIRIFSDSVILSDSRDRVINLQDILFDLLYSYLI